MKKFIIGLVCGILITIPVTVSATNELTAYLFPSKITIHRGDAAVEFNSMSDPFINYNNRIYVPLRTFATAMGSTVSYEGASASNGNINQINIYDIINENVPDVQDSDNRVSLYITNKAKTENGDIKIKGLMKINKDISGKIVYYGYNFVISNELTQPLEKGQIRYFTTLVSENDDTYNYTVELKNWGVPFPFIRGQVGGTKTDVTIAFGGKSAYPPISIGRGYYQNDSIMISNALYDTIKLNSLKLTYSIYKIENGKDILVCSYEIPGFDGGSMELPAGTRSNLSIPKWDFRDKNGNLVSPGKYEIRLTTPANFEFSIDGKPQTLPVEVLGSRFEFVLVE